MHMQNVAPLGSVLATGEGVYRLTSERKPAALTFNPDLPTKFAYAELKRGPNVDKYLIWSVNTTIFIYSTTSEERVSKLVCNAPCFGTRFLKGPPWMSPKSTIISIMYVMFQCRIH